ncbi:MAG: DMT family transporter [Halobacteriovoraceae bacterium]|nr:DMT family transporter [Halobacteriovoraceae bacterium]
MPNLNIIYLVIGTCCIGLAPIFVKMCHLSPSLIGFYRCGIAGLALLAYQLILKKPFPKDRRFYLITTLSGIFFAADLFVWHRSVHLLGPGMSTILGNTQVFYLLIIGYFLHKESLSLKKILIFIFAFFGTILIINGQMEFFSRDNFLWGTFFGLATGLCYSLYTTSIKQAYVTRFEPKPIQIITFVSISTAFWIYGLSFFDKNYPRSFQDNWQPLIGLAFICQIIGWGLITKAIKFVPLSVSGLIILLQPLIAKTLGVFIFNEPTSILEFMGTCILFTCIYFGSRPEVPKNK